MVDAPAVPHTIRTPNRILACGFHLVPRARGRLYLGATNWFGTDLALPKGPSVGELHSLLDSVMNQLNSSLYAVSIETTNWGLRPVAQFDRPLVGETSLPGLFIATGCHRTGVHMAPLLARMISEQVLDGAAGAENPFCPKTAPKAERPDVSAGVRALLAQALFPSGSLPFNRILELQVFVSTLLDLALDTDNGNQELRHRLRGLLTEVGQDEESVMRVFYEVLERELPECGPYPT